MSSARPPAAGPVLRAPVGLSYAVVGLLGLVVLADLVSIYAAVDMRGLVGDMPEGGFVPYSAEDVEFERADLLVSFSGGIYSVACLVTAVVFIIWFHRARINAGVFRPDLQRRGPGWAIGSWFIPIANLWIPRGIAGDIWAASESEQRTSRAVLNAWWTLWLVSSAINQVATAEYDHAADAGQVKELLVAADVLMISSVIDIAAAVLAVLFVRKLTAMQHAKALQGQAVATV